ncbi:YraN family protein [Serpentinicella sp. ANB-PHB4]|uniref:YraN family protein n=1 Tax=Serpentinicella sp. ANB-PHB4 TaxID=3074076 RepID=UPI00285C94EA|nr:YraN family protein [Serpentinicella sp. ANB-PHB4]MDR5658280.1 YraN family protein [Serpentinicella sp. ANB-PHB4]
MSRTLGDFGESIALEYFINNKYKVTKTNYRTKIGEIDIIAKKDKVIIFVEVKTRKNNKYGLPREAVTLKKQENIRRVAQWYIQEYKPKGYNYRFDVIEVYYNQSSHQINHIESAF